MTDSEQSGAGEQPPPPAIRWAKPGCVTLRCREHGPLVVELPSPESGPAPEFRVIDHAGGEFRLPEGKRAVALCRCGNSQKKPFCDGSHRHSDFRAADLAGDGA
jgi:CDGSH-type Zn-finger protein